jgi:hypothetical protein
MPISNQSETIDPRILRLIGLEDVFDLDYETYLTLLKEVMVKSRMVKKTIPTEEIMLVTDEYKRVKTKKDQGRFEVKKKKISSNSFNVTNIKGILLDGKKSQGLLPFQVIAKSPLKKSLDDNISAITAAVISINETLKNKQKVESDTSAYGKRQAEKEKRSLRESKLEKIFDGLKKTAEKIIAPVKSLLDKIFDFIGTVILGRIVYKLVEWMGDPKNESKLKSIIRFVKDWWPALLGSYVLFGTSFGKLIRGTIGLVGRFILQIGKVAIPQLLKFIKSPLGIGAALFTAGATVPALFPGTVNEQERKTDKESGSNADKIKSLQQQKANLNFFDKLWGKGAEIDEQMSYLQTGKTKAYGFNGGGFASGYVSGEKGVDKVPAMLSDGEFVMSRGAVEKYGVDTLESMNAAGGGTNKPKIVGGKTYAAGGGLIGKSEYYVSEILKGLSPKYKWAEGLARKAGISAQNTLQQSASGIVNEGVKAQRYFASDKMKDDAINLGNRAVNSLQNNTLQQSASGIVNEGVKYFTSDKMKDDAINLGNRAVNSLQNNFNTVKEVAKNVPTSISKLGTGDKYNAMAKNNEKKSQEAISKYDAWVQSLPKGFLKDTMNRGLIPIPTGNAFGMTGLTYVKAMLGPLGRPFKILSNKSVDKARQEMIDRTAAANGLRVGPGGKMSMEWNRISGPGSGQYTDDLKSLGGAGGFGGGKYFNSTFGRWSGTQKGDRIVTNDAYNFNEPVGVYAKKSMEAIKKGNIGQGLYNILSMAGKFAQDTGWMNQRALGSEIDVGSVKNIDPKTGKPKATTSPVTMYKPNDPRRNQSGPYKSRFTRPKNAGVKPVKPPTTSKPRVVYGPPVPQRRNTRGGGSTTNKPPRFSASTRGAKTKADLIGVHR